MSPKIGNVCSKIPEHNGFKKVQIVSNAKALKICGEEVLTLDFTNVPTALICLV